MTPKVVTLVVTGTQSIRIEKDGPVTRMTNVTTVGNVRIVGDKVETF